MRKMAPNGLPCRERMGGEWGMDNSAGREPIRPEPHHQPCGGCVDTRRLGGVGDRHVILRWGVLWSWVVMSVVPRGRCPSDGTLPLS